MLMCLVNAICLHDIYDAWCVKCKGKKANGSELQGAFWLLDSGTSHHFTGNRDDFANYQALSYKLYAKTANSKAEIVGIGTILLWTINHNGEEAIISHTCPSPTYALCQHSPHFYGQILNVWLLYSWQQIWPPAIQQHHIALVWSRS